MALKIRLARGGSKKRPFYRIVVAEATSPRDGLFVERVGSYNPLLPADHNERIVLNADRLKYWISVGAQPTDRVSKFLGNAGLAPKPALKNNPNQSAPKKKAQERMKSEAEAKEAAKAAKEAEKAAKEAAKAAAAAEPTPAAPEPEVIVEPVVAEEAATEA
jgi:small subunit ribosomal protein S16